MSESDVTKNLKLLIKSRFQRLSVFVLIAIAIMILGLYIVFKSFQETAKAAHQNALIMTAETFSKSVELANAVYDLSRNEGPVSNLDRFNSGNVDFNSRGFPIGEYLSEQGEEPNSVYACIDVWNAVLGVIRPMASADKDSDYRAEFYFHDEKPWCRYHYNRGGNLYIDYWFREGEVRYKAEYQD